LCRLLDRGPARHIYRRLDGGLIMVHMLESCFHEQLVGNWQPKFKKMIPSCVHDLRQEATLLKRVRAETAEILGLQDV